MWELLTFPWAGLGAVPLCVMPRLEEFVQHLPHLGLCWASLHPAEYFLHRALQEFLPFPRGLMKIQEFQESKPSTLGEHPQQMCSIVVPIYSPLTGAPPWLWTPPGVINLTNLGCFSLSCRILIFFLLEQKRATSTAALAQARSRFWGHTEAIKWVTQ